MHDQVKTNGSEVGSRQLKLYYFILENKSRPKRTTNKSSLSLLVILNRLGLLASVYMRIKMATLPELRALAHAQFV